MDELTAYDKQTLKEIDEFKHPVPSRLGSWWRRLSAPLDQAAERAFESSVGSVAVRAVQDVVDVINDGATWSVRRGAIFDRFQDAGHDQVRVLKDIRTLSLQDIDELTRSLAAKYQGLAVAEGAGSGLLGGLAMAADVGLVVGLALRAANEYATYYGCDVTAAGERLFVVRILAAASSPTVAERTQALADLTTLSLELCRSDGWRLPDSASGRRVTKKIAEALAVRILKAKLGQAIPLAGVVIASGYNAWLLTRVTETAYCAYRERFLIQKHGEAVLTDYE